MKDWFKPCKDYKRILRFQGEGEFGGRSQFLWPASLDYDCSLNPIFLKQIKDLQLLSFAPNWLIRDGWIPLVLFFSKFPKPPPNWQSRLLIHSSMNLKIPEEWRSFVGTFSILERRTSVPRTTTLIICGLVTETYCSLDHFSNQLMKARALIETNTGLPWQLKFCLVEAGSAVHRKRRHVYLAEYYRILYDLFGTDLALMSWQEFYKADTFNGVLIIDLNDKMICADSYLTQHALAYGATLLDNALQSEVAAEKSDVEKSEFFRLSPYHGVEVIWEPPPTPKYLAQWNSLEDILECQKDAVAQFYGSSVDSEIYSAEHMGTVLDWISTQ